MNARRAVRAAARTLALAAAVAPASAGEARVHVVQPGETLWQIAAATTGDPFAWSLIYRANRDQIKDPAVLYPGQRLTIPDGPAPVDAAPALPAPVGPRPE